MSDTYPPIFKLYGEAQAWPAPDLLHCETIESRSRLHAWTIATHRHADLAQLLYVREGRVELQLEDWRGTLSGPLLVVLPALCVHAFAFEPAVQGFVITLPIPQVERLKLRCQRAGRGLFQQAAKFSLAGPEASWMDQAVGQLVDEYEGRRPGREVMLEALLDSLAIWLLRQQTQAVATNLPRRADQHLGRFLALVEQHYRAHWNLGRYAAALGISGVHLNALCRELTGASALAIVHQRLLLEARRNLSFTQAAVAEIADALGFTDPAYFARFFRRGTGQSPLSYRRRAGARAQD
ncbi:MAG: helix-turn-helix domain-containing protein [Pseudomonas oryzihabitans]